MKELIKDGCQRIRLEPEIKLVVSEMIVTTLSI